MQDKSILDLPNEIIRDVLFKHLGPIEIFVLGEAGNQRLKELAQEYIGYSEGKLKLILIYYHICCPKIKWI